MNKMDDDPVWAHDAWKQYQGPSKASTTSGLPGLTLEGGVQMLGESPELTVQSIKGKGGYKSESSGVMQQLSDFQSGMLKAMDQRIQESKEA